MTEHPDACPRCGFVLLQPPPPPVPYVSYPAPPPPAPPPPRPRGISAASVPKILLGLGATCLLVAAVIFLAVAWTWLDVGGRTLVLVGLTAGSGLAGRWLVRRDLGLAAEAVTTVGLGLVVLDVVGAAHAGWLGDPSFPALVTAVGAALLVASLAACLPSDRLFAPQLAAPLGLGLAGAGLVGATNHLPLVATAAVVGSAGLVSLGRALGAVLLPWTALVCGLLWYVALALFAFDEAIATPSLRWMWVEGHGVWLLVVAGLALLPWPMVPGRDDLRQLACAAAASVLTVTAVAPVVDEGATAVALVAAATAAFWALPAAAAPRRWYAVPRVPLVGAVVVLLPPVAWLAAHAASNLFDVAAPFTADASVRLHPEDPVVHPWMLPVGVLVTLLSVAVTLPQRRQLRWAAIPVAAVTALLTAALYPLPLWAFVLGLGPLGVVVALPSAVLTLVALAETAALAATLLVRRRAEPVAAAVLPLALAGCTWTGGHLLDVPFEVRSLATLGLGLLAIAVPRLELEVATAVAVLVVAAVGVPAADDPSVALAIHLTLAGALVTVTAMVHRGHRPLAWLGGLLLAAATWVRLWDVGVHAPEAYTLPTAVVLVLVGGHRLWRDRDADSSTTLLPGLALATVPSLLWALADPVTPRAALLGAGCLVLLLAGSALRWSAPVVVGWVVGALLVLRELAPYAAAWPQWVLIGTAGTVLLAAGVTWEARVRDVRRAAAYLGRLR